MQLKDLNQAILDSKEIEQDITKEVQGLKDQQTQLEQKKCAEQSIEHEMVKKQVAQHKALITGFPDELRNKYGSHLDEFSRALDAFAAMCKEAEDYKQKKLDMDGTIPPLVAGANGGNPQQLPPPGGPTDTRTAVELEEVYEADDDEMDTVIEEHYKDELADSTGEERKARKKKLAKSFTQVVNKQGLVKKSGKKGQHG